MAMQGLSSVLFSYLPSLPSIDDVAHGDQERDCLAATPVGLGAKWINSKVS